MNDAKTGSSLSAEIRSVLQSVGFEEEIPDDSTELRDLGFDSLMIALSVVELERRFSVKIAVDQIGAGAFRSIASIAKTIEKARGEK